MRQMAILLALLFLLACPLTLASDAARMTLPSGMNSPLTIRYPELAQAPPRQLSSAEACGPHVRTAKKHGKARAEVAAPQIEAALILS